MRHWMPLLLALVTAAGCTSSQLRRSTVRQVSTLTNLQHQLVLNNLAAFVCNPDAIPFQANLRGGATQVVDSGNASVEYLAGMVGVLGVGRTAVDQWVNAPVTDEPTLRLLRIAYRRCVGIDEDVYTQDFANRLAHRLKVQLPTANDMALENAHMFARGPALPQLLDRAGWKGDTNPGFTGDDPSVKLWKKDTSDIISVNSERIVQRGEVLTSENLTVTPVLVNGLPVVWPEEKSPRLLVATPYASELRRQVLVVNECLMEINPGWLNWGTKHDVPKCACNVAHYKGCNCEVYVWVLPQYDREFEEFVLKVMRLSTMILDPYGQTTQGVIYSPPVTR